MDRMDRPTLCVLCRTRPVDPKWRPFCSRRCQVIDQGRWATESYRVPGSQAEQREDEATDQDDG
jgi:uncharacterized protein